MKIMCEVSLGELIDKITILRIKTRKITDLKKKQWAQEELEILSETLEKLNLKQVEQFISRLEEVNHKLWVIEDDIRLKEMKGEFDKEFVELARSVYRTNDKRFEIKNEINSFYGSGIKEVKSYEKYE